MFKPGDWVKQRHWEDYYLVVEIDDTGLRVKTPNGGIHFYDNVEDFQLRPSLAQEQATPTHSFWAD